MHSDLEAAPGAIPILGHLLLLFARGDRQVELWSEVRRNQLDKNKTLTMCIPFMRVIDGTSPKTIEHVQKFHFHKYKKGPLVGNVLAQVLGDGIFAVDDEKVRTASYF